MVSTRRFSYRASPAIISLLLLGMGGCGGGDGDGARPPNFDGPFALTAGAKAASFSLGAEDVDITCVPKPGLKEFEFEGKDPASGNGLHLSLKEYAGEGAMKLEYGVDKPRHVVDVSVGGGFKYRFFQHLRTDTDEVFNSRCDLQMTEQRNAGVTRYGGHLNCTLLFADANSPDYAGASRMNAFIDLVARFECER